MMNSGETNDKRETLKTRFDVLALRYGALWKNIIESERKKERFSQQSSFLAAIEKQQAVKFKIDASTCPFAECAACAMETTEDHQSPRISPTFTDALFDDDRMGVSSKTEESIWTPQKENRIGEIDEEVCKNLSELTLHRDEESSAKENENTPEGQVTTHDVDHPIDQLTSDEERNDDASVGTAALLLIDGEEKTFVDWRASQQSGGEKLEPDRSDRVESENQPGSRKPKNRMILPPDSESDDEKVQPCNEDFSSGDAFKGSVPRKAGLSESRFFSKNRQWLAGKVLAEFNEVAFGGRLRDVNVSWSKTLRTTAGITRLVSRKRDGLVVERLANIELSTKVIDNDSRLRSTLLHECCHAAQWLIDGVSKPPHGDAFKKWAKIAMRKIPSIEVTTTHSYEISFKYAWACTSTGCGVLIQRHSRSVDVEKHRCARCKGALVEIEPPSRNDHSSVRDRIPKKKKVPSAYNIFVKENSSEIRTRLKLDLAMRGETRKVTQSDVMKECARMWKDYRR